MIDAKELLTDCRRVADALVDDLRARTDDHEESRESARLVYAQAQMAGRTDKTWEEWREDLLAQVASGWVLAAVFVRFCEDNRLVEDPLLSGPGDRGPIARDHRAEFFAANPEAGDREWLQEVFDRYRKLPAVSEVFGERNPLWQLAPSADGARELLELWWATDEDGTRLRHDFADPDWGTRFLGDLYQDLSEHARKQYALLQTPGFVEEFILDRTLGPAIAEFGLNDLKMIDPTCGSGHFLLGAFDRLVEAWREAEPNTPPRELAQRALDSVNGVDVNPFAVAIARFRLLVAGLKVSGEVRLGNLPGFQLNLAVGDSLLHGSHGGMLFPPEDVKSALAHHYPTEDVDEADRILQANTYHAVVGNPPYINPNDAALNLAYRALFKACHKQYQLTAPFIERFIDLARPQGGGHVGCIVGSAFAQRAFGVPLVKLLGSVDLTHVIDTRGVYVPGHGTPTAILLLRNRKPTYTSVRVALAAMGEGPSTHGRAWHSIVDNIDQSDFEDEWVTIRDVNRQTMSTHPWALKGGGAIELQARLDARPWRIRDAVIPVGYVGQSNMDDAFMAPASALRTRRVEPSAQRPVLVGDEVRDWNIASENAAVFPYDSSGNLLQLDDCPGASRWLWPSRRLLEERRTFSKKSYRQEGRPWWEWHQVTKKRLGHEASIILAFVATNNEVAVDRESAITNRSALQINPSSDSNWDIFALAFILSSSVSSFYLKQLSFTQGAGGGSRVAQGFSVLGTDPWEATYQFDGRAVEATPLPSQAPQSAERVVMSIERAVTGLTDPMGTDRALSEELGTAVALQEEIDWECYALYGLTDEPLTSDLDAVPPLQKGERAFEIALARRMTAGDVESTWFVRHGSRPVTEVPAHWPDEYRLLVERRLELIENDRSIRLLERPEYKRRWNWDDLDELGRRAQRKWLTDRVEALIGDRDAEPAVTTVARLADRLAQDPDAVQIARDLAGASVDMVDLVDELVAESAVPFLAAWRYTDSGMVKRRAWERTWDLQRVEDRLGARAALPEDDPDHLDESTLELARKEAGVQKIPVPPKYATKDFRDMVTYKMRGKLDVPKERFISYPGTNAGADTTTIVGWAGWDHLQQARALAAHYNTRRSDGAETDELVPLLAGLAELVPWLKQWHNEPDPTFGERMGDFFAGFVDSEAAAIGVTTKDLADWRPPAKSTRRRKKKASS